MKALRFVDLFAGLGGFHIAVRRLGHECVFACEIDESLRELYALNFGVEVHGDIRVIEPSSIPQHDILCAGFPCQPFSKAGDQQGLKCRRWGNLFENVVKILHYHRPTYLILENVPNLIRHNRGRTWGKMKRKLDDEGYSLADHRFSPHQFGIPQIRDRVYIVGSRSGLNGFTWPIVERHSSSTSIIAALEKHPKDARPISQQVFDCLEVWQEFVARFPKDEELPTFPIWSMEFGATYPYEFQTPHSAGAHRLGRCCGSHGVPLSGLSLEDKFRALPSYARVTDEQFPDWKIRFIQKNRDLYQRHKRWIDRWMPKILRFPSSLQKLEWNCKGGKRNIWRYLIQFRASGVRVKRPTSSPSLVAMTTTQVPIIGWERRYMTPRECAKLQSLSELKHVNNPSSITATFRALGNAVNADVVERIARCLLPNGTKKRKTHNGGVVGRMTRRVSVVRTKNRPS